MSHRSHTRPGPAALLALCLWAALCVAAPGIQAAPGDGTAADAPAASAHAAAVQRGEYLFHAAGGCGCHTDVPHHGQRLAGGRALKTPFGTFYSTNITPDPETGIGRWSEADFVRAMRQGVGPNGRQYFPVFPYTSFTEMSDADLHDLWAYLSAQPAVHQPNRPNDVWPPFGWRIGIPFWKWLFFHPHRFQPDPKRSAAWNRGAYLAQAVAHCGECHTPRNLLGAREQGRRYAGSARGPDGQVAPNITPDPKTGIGSWDTADLTWLLATGGKPDGDDVQGLMGEAIEQGYGKLTDADRTAIADFVRSVPPIQHKVVAAKKDK